MSTVELPPGEEDNSTLTAGFAALALGNQILNPETTPDGDAIPDEIPNNQNQNGVDSLMRPFIDPGLVVQKHAHVSETWLSDFVSPQSAPQGAYSPLAQAVKKLLPERAACRLGCKGARCKYERSDYWRPEQMAINGIFSHWITDNILACSRPTERHSDLTKLFLDAGIRALFNLESPDEHIFCGHGNHQSGFSYNPSAFMDVGIFVYNFAMEDYGTVKVDTILDIMRVMSFAMKQGKIAVHCHAGLGRTGFVICSYLVHEYRMTAYESVHYIRAKRPGSVQMTKQIEAVAEYERFLIPKRRVFTDCADITDKLSLEIHLKNQQAFVHGRDAYIFKYISRVIFVCAARLVELCTGYIIDTILLTINRRTNAKSIFVRENLHQLTDEEKATWLDFAPSFLYEHERLTKDNFLPAKQILNCMIVSIDQHSLSIDQQNRISIWKQKINKTNNGIDGIFEETDPCVISALMWNWLRLLKTPVLSKDDFKHFTKTEVQSPKIILSELTKFQCGTIELLAKMFAYIRRFALGDEDRLLLFCLIHVLTQRPLSDTEEIKQLTINNEKIRQYLISEQADFHDTKRHSVIEFLGNDTGLNRELLDRLATFLANIFEQFEQ